MKEVGTDNIPVSGSKAATKRKERLEFQVPPHDLDASLCHNLSESEATQMGLYVQKIKENSVGQGVVVRVGDSHHANIEYMNQSTETAGLENQSYIRDMHEHKDMGVNTDEDFQIQKPTLGRVNRENEQHISNANRQWADSSIQTDTNVEIGPDDSFKPTPFQKSFQKKQGMLMQQETPVRKMNFDRKTSDANLHSIASAIQRDQILSKIFGAESIRKAIYNPSTMYPHTAIVVCDIPMVPDFHETPHLTVHDKAILSNICVDPTAIQSAIVNGSIYDQLFNHLDNYQADYSECTILQPMKALRLEYANSNNDQFKNNLHALVAVMEKENPISGVPSSVSQDSGFESQLSTPNNGRQPIHFAEQNSNDTAFCFSSLLDVLNDLSPAQANHVQSVQPSSNKSINPNMEESHPLHAVTTCKSCDGDIYAGMVAVKAARADKTHAWHPKCFKCHTCGDLLADLVYFFHGGNIYCGRDLAHILKIPRCKACDELIFTKEYTAAEGATFHIKHFCCYQCDIPLAGQQYIPDDQTNMPMCLNCYETFHAAKCQNCQQPIAATEEGVNWNNVHWHKNCFICANVRCGKSLIGGRFCIRQEMPFCSPQCVATHQF